jgi:hypothetical protein
MPFAKGQSGNREGGRRHRGYVRKAGLTQAYKRTLTQIDEVSGKTYADLVATTMIAASISGDLASTLVCVGEDARGLIKAAIAKMVREDKVSALQAEMVWRCFMPEIFMPVSEK